MEGGNAMVKAVIFDMDGLMLDTERYGEQFHRRALEERGLPFLEGLSARITGRNHAEVRRILFEDYGPDYPFEEVRARIGELWEEYLSGHPVPVKPGLFPLLDYLKERSIPAAVATSTSRATALPRLEKAGIAPYLSAMVFGDMVEKSKPEPDIFLTAAMKMEISPAEAMVLEDSPSGILAAHRAGMLPVMIPDLLPPDRELEGLLYRRLERLDEVIGLLEEMREP